MQNKKSAKDIAFDKERAKFRKQIRELEREKCSLANKVMDLNGMLQERDAKIEELQDWIRRLLEYTELSEEDMRKIIQKSKDAVEILDELTDIAKVISRFGFFGGRF